MLKGMRRVKDQGKTTVSGNTLYNHGREANVLEEEDAETSMGFLCKDMKTKKGKTGFKLCSPA